MKNNFPVYAISTFIISIIMGVITGVLGLVIIGPDWFVTCGIAGFLATMVVLLADYE